MRTGYRIGINKAGEREVGKRLYNALAGDFLNLFVVVVVVVVATGRLLGCCQGAGSLGLQCGVKACKSLPCQV